MAYPPQQPYDPNQPPGHAPQHPLHDPTQGPVAGMPPGYDQPPPPAPKKGVAAVLRSRCLPWTLAGLLALALAGVLIAPRVGTGGPSGTEVLAAARQGCDAATAGTRLDDDDKTLIVESKGEEDLAGVSATQLARLVEKLQMPASVQARLTSTRALDGRQEAAWEGYKATWTYHPNSGLDLIVTAE